MRNILLILVLQLVYVPLLALRTISMVKKLRILTAVFGFVESIIYVFGLAIVLSGDQNVIEMLVYALGFGVGLVVGIEVENRIAIGYTSFEVNIKHLNQELIDTLRSHGYGVTIFEGSGLSSTRYRLDILTRRAKEIDLVNLINEYEPAAFIMAFEPTRFKGGFIEDLMKRRTRNSKINKKWFTKKKQTIGEEITELVSKETEV